MKAADIMTTKVLTINNLATVAEAIAKMQDHCVRSLIVEPSDRDDAYGIITETDVIYSIIAKQKDPETILVYQIMSKPCIVVNPDLSLYNVARLFAETGIEKAPVIKEKLLGMISATDLMMKLKVARKPATDLVSAKVHEAILHNRIVSDPKEQIDRECEIAWDVVEELQTE
ncbi:conserved hypothetical protein [Hyella patelloides LEGE 07179]|uniref:CBS domain-containing protein n=1 Tax=Hyella patelloides LEGE 07179 TaxID=945734 RepID=A0A563W4L3_9CYAN|nr:CBS domain-containing protein [Hyella patelloides]VEP18631.1 conserved hypothetical protein [Hyella patelloides LEGE 07179]